MVDMRSAQAGSPAGAKYHLAHPPGMDSSDMLGHAELIRHHIPQAYWVRSVQQPTCARAAVLP